MANRLKSQDKPRGMRKILIPLHVKLIFPSVFVLGLVILYPLVSSLVLSLFNYELTRPDEMKLSVLKNYGMMIDDDVFWLSLKNTLVFTGVSVGVSLIVGLIGAITLDQLPKRLAGLRGVILVPWLIPGVIVGFLFMLIFDVQVGVANVILERAGIIKTFLPWLMDDQLAEIAVIIANIWNQVPFYILMFTAGLKAIPAETKEAAIVEGAGRWQEFVHVTLPHLRGILIITSLLMVIRNFNNFPLIYTMTGGGPVYSTTTFVIYIYRLAFEQFNIGYASAVGVVWCLVLLGLSSLYIKVLTKQDSL
ncbi:carbohydrate ABC transporter permease [Desulfosporosinus sp. BICA1-9]|uniref:carbohydrate ABC transporter permease n=1 Tax=Desulfosporosinus sp. BICA1-9 TaxID=1531958 RepID=UPI00054B9D35|nr:sugar ABC transporter permease [Desulfosporosinus sp. BICA1-9]KJS49003.1 MAG: ABC transporter permease [Peptococcaceae bacterium BRH_c23]KJS78069.1 MAG: ABC transporter permease [Desulfosporosinus sp. BICA1-9]HBW34142.1 sugar ABC transporter permease [Desulfosporosinus sp.]